MKHTESEIKIKETVEACEQICNLVTSDGRYCDLVAKIYPTVDGGEQEANAERFAALWNAADGKSNEDAVKALTHYEELVKELQGACFRCRTNADHGNIEMSCRPCRVRPLLANLNKEGTNEQ